jgi:DNA relaxase NicK
VYYDPAGKLIKKHIVLELPGSFLAPVPGADRVELMRQLRLMGFKPTRLDLAIDWRGVGIQLIEAMRRACEAGELCGARRWKPHREFSGRRVVGDGVSVGKRGGDGSGRYLRAYDKGLETGTVSEGGWVRVELELADDCAAQAADVLCEAGQWEAAAVELVLGAVDFREVTGDKHLAKRPRAAWWAAVLDGVEGVRVVASRSAAKLQTYAAWLKRAVFRPLQSHADELGMSLREVVCFMVGEHVEPSRASGMTAVGHQLRELVRECRAGGGVLPASVGELLLVRAG